MEDVSSCGKELEVASGGVKETPQTPNYYPYPPPSAKYEEISGNPKLFRSTLEKLHCTMGTKFMIPIIGGKELDLHRLFVEVTSRGGIEQVIRERRWKEVTAVFNFPSTATNASFVLRKYYVSLLHHYEQIYFFRAKGWTPPSDLFPSPSPTPISAQGLVERVRPSLEGHVAVTHKRSKVAVSPSVGYPVSGVIDGKFEHGYFVTIMVGTEKLRGVLYHTSRYPTDQVPPNPGKDDMASGPHRRRRRKKSEMRKRDPSHPKPNRSGYNFFFAEQHARLKPLHPGKDREISKMIGELWNKLTETEKAVYQEKGFKDKERYRTEMEEYREKLKTDPIISDAVPIQQRLAAPEEVMKVEGDEKLEDEVVMVEGNEKLEAEEVDGSSSSETDSDDEKTTADKDSEMETSVGGGNGDESSKVEVVMVERDEKLEAEEVAGSSSGKTDTDDDRTAEKNSEMETCVGGGNGAESGKVEEVVVEVDEKLEAEAEVVMVEGDEKLEAEEVGGSSLGETDSNKNAYKETCEGVGNLTESSKVAEVVEAEGERGQEGDESNVVNGSSLGNVAESINTESVSNDGH